MPTPALVAIIVVAVVAALAGAAIWLRGRLRDAGIYVIPRTKFGMALVFSVEGDDGEPRARPQRGRHVPVGDLSRRRPLLPSWSSRLTRCCTTSMFDAPVPTCDRVLMIGGGGYCLPQALHQPPVPEARIATWSRSTPCRHRSSHGRYFFLDRLIEEYETRTHGTTGADRRGRLRIPRRPDGSPTFLDERTRMCSAALRRHSQRFVLGQGAGCGSPCHAWRRPSSIHGCLDARWPVSLTNVVVGAGGRPGPGFIRAIVATLRRGVRPRLCDPLRAR